MDFIDYVDLVPGRLGREHYLLLYVPDIIDARIRCTVYLYHINRLALGDLPAGVADSAWMGAHPALAVQSLGQKPRGTCLADSSWP